MAALLQLIKELRLYQGKGNDPGLLLVSEALEALASQVQGNDLESVDLPLEFDAGTGILSIKRADINNDGYLSTGDWATFNDKWGQVGNAAVGGAFIGTTNAQPLLMRANNVQMVSISGDGNNRYVFTPSPLTMAATYLFAIGYQPTVNSGANWSFVGGYTSTIGTNALVAFAFGYNARVNYNYGAAFNSGTIANANGSFAANNAQVNAFYGAGFGMYNEIATDPSTPTGISAGNRIFILGNGSGTSNRHNALTVLHGSDVINGTKPLFGFNRLDPVSTVDIAGSLSLNYVAKTADYTASDLDYTIHFTANTSTLTLPTAVGCTGRIYIAKNTSGNVLTLATTSAQTIDGAAPGTVANGAAAQFQSTGANWIKIN